jgi:hypothetical protein
MTALMNNRLLINEPVIFLLSLVPPAIILCYGLAGGKGGTKPALDPHTGTPVTNKKNYGDFSFFRVSRNIPARTTMTRTTTARIIHDGRGAPCCWPPDGGMTYGVTG